MYKTQGPVGTCGYIAYEDETPRYVGIGSPTRKNHLFKRYNSNRILNAYLKAGFKFRVEEFVFETSREAVKWECKMIQVLGRVCNQTGTLFNFSEGGEHNAKNLKWYHNPSTQVEVRLPVGTVVSAGWAPGRNSKTNSGLRVYHNTKTLEIRLLSEPPDEWVLGYPPGQHRHARGTQLFFNTATQEHKRFSRDETPPDPWVERPPTTGKKFKYTPKPSSHWRHIRNPETGERRRIPPDSPLPQGWVAGTGTTNTGSFSAGNPRNKKKTEPQ